MHQEKAVRLHTVIAAGRELVDDKTASIAPELFGMLKESGSLISHGTRINWNGTLKKAAVDLWDRAVLGGAEMYPRRDFCGAGCLDQKYYRRKKS